MNDFERALNELSHYEATGPDAHFMRVGLGILSTMDYITKRSAWRIPLNELGTIEESREYFRATRKTFKYLMGSRSDPVIIGSLDLIQKSCTWLDLFLNYAEERLND